MVLQRDASVAIWGKAAPGAEIKLSVAGQEKNATADTDGNWNIRLDPLKPGGPYKLEAKTNSGQSLVIDNVLFGDVWLCSGQSNMEFKLSGAMNASEEKTKADYPEIRYFRIEKNVSPTPLDAVRGNWLVCNPKNSTVFSAVAYFFAREIWNATKIPVGLIDSSWGGIHAESWVPRADLEKDPDLKPIVQRYDDALKAYPEKMKEYQESIKRWETENAGVCAHSDSGNEGEKMDWQAPSFDDSAWTDMKLPTYWEDVRGNEKLDGAVWFRKTIVVPKEMAGNAQTLSLGPIDDFDTVYFNGKKVGSTGKDTDNFWEVRRKYPVPAELVREGKAVVAVRVFDHKGNGGIYGAAQELYLGSDIGSDSNISLAGDWKFKVEKTYDPSLLKPEKKPSAPLGPESPFAVSGLYNSMIYPTERFGIKGAIWYQGETNAGRAWQYRKLLPCLINSWRRGFGQGDFPFFIVQLANFKDAPQTPGNSAWAELREAQMIAAKSVPNSAVACAIDIGDAKDIHPKNKQEVGRRLALLALDQCYGKSLVDKGPEFDSLSIEGIKARVKFKNVGGGLVSKDSLPLAQFSIAGADKKFVWADAEIDGDSVIVSSPEVISLVAVRYAWAENPESANLANKEGLPAYPFRTDDLQGCTFDKK